MIFVTGGTGLLGNCIVRELLERGYPTRVLCRSGTSRKPFEGLDVEIIEGDLSNKPALETAIQGTTATIHSAAYIHIGWDNLQRSRDVNVLGTENVAKACAQHGSKLVHISTVDTLPAARRLEEPISESDAPDRSGKKGVEKTPCSYVVSKKEAERVVERLLCESNLQAVTIHPGFMLAPFDWKPSSGRMMIEVSKAPIVAAPPGGCSVCDARDVAAAVVRATEVASAGEHYILAGRNLAYRELWQAMLESMGKRKRVFRLGPLVKLVGKAIDLANRMLPIEEGDVNGASIRMGYLNHYYNSGKAERDLDYQLRPLEQTLDEAWSWLSKQHKDI